MGKDPGRTGDLEELPFGELLAAVYASKRTVVLDIRRAQVEKRITVEEGVPVACRGNLLHETFGNFLVKQGVLEEEVYQEALRTSVSSGEQMGHVLLAMGALTAFDLYKRLQQNLAHKLLDVFTWTGGEYRVLGEVPEIDSSLKINVPQLILTGALRFTPQDVVDAGLAPLVGKPLGIDPRGPLAELKLNAQRTRAVNSLRSHRRIDELLAEGGLPAPELSRLLYALHTLGVVSPAAELPVEPPSQEAPAPVAADPSETAKTSDEELMRIFLNHRQLDAFALLELETDAMPFDIDRAWQVFAERFAPWSFTGDAREQAARIFNAGARAYALLADPERRNSLVHKRAQPTTAKPKGDRYRIRTDLLDAKTQFDEGRALAAAGRYTDAVRILEYAADLDPPSSEYSAELAYTRFLEEPRTAGIALDALNQILSSDPECGPAHLYAGEVRRGLGDFAGARSAYEAAQRCMPSDPRAAQALRELA